MRAMRYAVALVAVGVLTATACSKFKGSTRLDMGPFAENTTSMLAEAQRILQPLPWEHLREYQEVARSDTSIKADVDAVRGIFRGIGMYSIQVVSLNASRLPDERRVGLLAEYFADVLRPVVEAGVESEFGLTRSRVDSTLAAIRQSPDFLSAIGAADPLVYNIVQFAIQRVDRVSEVTQPAFEAIRSDVEKRYQGTVEEVKLLDRSEAADVRTYLALQDYRTGAGTRDAVTALDPLLAGVLTGKDAVAEYEEAQRILRARLAATDATRAQLDVKMNEYRVKMAEAFDLNSELDRRVRAARMMLVYWLRAHRNLAQGVQVPPAINVEQMLGSSARKAVGTVMP